MNLETLYNNTRKSHKEDLAERLRPKLYFQNIM